MPIFPSGFNDINAVLAFTKTEDGTVTYFNGHLPVFSHHQNKFGATPEDVRLALEAENIEARPVWKPMHIQPVFKDCRVRGGSVAEDLFSRGLCLPSGTALTDENLERVVDCVVNVYRTNTC